MKFLYVPWRSNYVTGTRDKNKRSGEQADCPFCVQPTMEEDKKHFILGRYKYNFVILNLHPYNTGHLMVIPYRHVKSLSELNKDEKCELMELLSLSTGILEDKLKPDGINIGMNLGKAAGAGIPTHIHMHVIPRWLGDTNFLPVIAETKTISVDLNKIYADLKPGFDVIKIEC